AFRAFVLANPAALEIVGAATAARASHTARVREEKSAAAQAAEPPSSLLARIRRFLSIGGVLAVAVAMPLTSRAADDGLQFASPDGRRMVSAVRATAPITVDGALDEAVWRDAPPAAEFVQAEPFEGQPATEATEVRLAYDRDALYIGVRCFDRTASRLIV